MKNRLFVIFGGIVLFATIFAKNIDLIKLIKNDKNITNKVSEKKINNIITYSKHFKNVNYIFKRVFKK